MGITASDDIAAYLQAQIPALGTVYVGRVPATPDAVVSVTLAPDSLGPLQALGATQGWDQPSLTVYSRAVTYSAAHALIKLVYDHLNSIQSGTFDGKRWLHIECVGLPVELPGRDDNERMRFSLSVRGWRAL